LAKGLADAGTRLIGGRYRLAAPIGRGAMGTVWRARDGLLDRDVAIKEVRFPASVSEAERDNLCQRTLREARAAARLSHPAVAAVHDVVEELGCPWIVMELLHGRSLDQDIKRNGPLSPKRAAEMGRQLLAALAAAHAAGVLHRDVKPGNVLLTRDGRAVLTDFGIATIDGDPSLTQIGMLLGSPAFLAPERIHGGAATPAADLWSLGATLYAAVEGQGPYDRCGDATATMAAVITSDPPPPQTAGPLTVAITMLLSRDPAARPSAAAATHMLEAAAGAAATVPRHRKPLNRPPPWAVTAAATCLIVLLPAAIWVLAHQATRTRTPPASPPLPTPTATSRPGRPHLRPHHEKPRTTDPGHRPYQPPDRSRGTLSGNHALAAAMTASSTQPGYPASNASDGNPGTYWESLDGAGYPQTLTADLGSAQAPGSVVLTLPPTPAWSARTQSLAVLGSTDGSTYTTLVSPASYTFDPSAGNTVTITLPPGTSERYLRLSITGNSGWSAAQIAEFEIFSRVSIR
jgi:serine/threonine protein kinase